MARPFDEVIFCAAWYADCAVDWLAVGAIASLLTGASLVAVALASYSLSKAVRAETMQIQRRPMYAVANLIAHEVGTISGKLGIIRTGLQAEIAPDHIAEVEKLRRIRTELQKPQLPRVEQGAQVEELPVAIAAVIGQIIGGLDSARSMLDKVEDQIERVGNGEILLPPGDEAIRVACSTLQNCEGWGRATYQLLLRFLFPEPTDKIEDWLQPTPPYGLGGPPP